MRGLMIVTARRCASASACRPAPMSTSMSPPSQISASKGSTAARPILCHIQHLQMRYFSEGSDRLHSTDIAFKPAEAGWGGGSKYSKNFDNIFGKKKNEDDSSNARTTSDTTSSSQAQSKRGGE